MIAIGNSRSSANESSGAMSSHLGRKEWLRKGLVTPLLTSVDASCGHDMSLEICLMNKRNLSHYAENVWD